MSQSYQLSIYQQGKLLGNFQSNTTQALQAIADLHAYLKSHGELSFELYQLTEDSRLLLQKDGVLQLLGTTVQYTPCSMDILASEVS